MTPTLTDAPATLPTERPVPARAATPAMTGGKRKVKFATADGFQQAMKAKIDRYFRYTKQDPRDSAAMYLKTATIFLLFIASYTLLVFVVTKLVNISRINPAVAYLTGCEPAELIDLPLARIVRLAPDAPAAESPLYDPIARALSDGRDLRDQPAIITDKRGRTQPVRFSLFPLRDRDKVVGGVVIVQPSPVAPAAR